MAAAAVALPLVGLAKMIGSDAVGAADVAVGINNFAFSPGSATVPVGTRVVWTNMQAGVPHTVTSDTGLFDSGMMAPNATFSFTFSTAGTFPYHCNVHPNMHGTVVVTQAAGATTAPTTTAPSATAPSAPAPTATVHPTTAPTTAPPSAPKTGGGGEAPNSGFIRRLGDG
jgi:plastocyanin